MYIDCWVKKHTYDSFKEVLGSGLQCHLQVSAARPAHRGGAEGFPRGTGLQIYFRR